MSEKSEVLFEERTSSPHYRQKFAFWSAHKTTVHGSIEMCLALLGHYYNIIICSRQCSTSEAFCSKRKAFYGTL